MVQGHHRPHCVQLRRHGDDGQVRIGLLLLLCCLFVASSCVLLWCYDCLVCRVCLWPNGIRFRPSLEEASPIQNQHVALDYIGKRGSAVNVGRRERIQYARDILQKEVFIPILQFWMQASKVLLQCCIRSCLTLAQRRTMKPKKYFLWATLCTRCLCAH